MTGAADDVEDASDDSTVDRALGKWPDCEGDRVT